jgi:two-component system, OmpR family, response regulator
MKRRILVVDDDVNITKLIKLNLERTGKFEVRVENKGANAINAALECQPDLILLDVMMPGVSGDVIATQLKEDSRFKAIKVVFLTAIVTRDETADDCNEISGNFFLAKPVSTQDLLYIIDKVLTSSDTDRC